MAGIFHFVSALSVQDFARAVAAALPRGRSHHDEGELLILDSADLALRRHGWCLSLSRHVDGARLSLRRFGHQARLVSAAPKVAPSSVHAIAAPHLQARVEKLLGDATLEVVQRWLAGGNSTGASSGTACPIVGVALPGQPRHYRYGYGVLDENLNMQADPGEKKVYFEVSDYTNMVFFESPR